MDAENNFNLIDSFDIDDESLKGLTPQMIFALGVEWEQFRMLLKLGRRFRLLVLPANAERLVKMAERHGRFVESRPNICPGYTEVWLGDFLPTAAQQG
ncbi:MAG TPA: hypothetical protein VH413_16245 [Verrucomicrobiae bacterium]|jgi:hypothetical protein|nr:hypothetical protein [Verrucomicrobiae bacterium]